MGCGHFVMEPMYSPPLPETKLESTWMTVCVLFRSLQSFHWEGGQPADLVWLAEQQVVQENACSSFC